MSLQSRDLPNPNLQPQWVRHNAGSAVAKPMATLWATSDGMLITYSASVAFLSIFVSNLATLASNSASTGGHQ
eukprot:3336296-Amphidinium_carterae.1